MILLSLGGSMSNEKKNPYQDLAQDLNVPLIPPIPEKLKDNNDPNPVVAVCGECGRGVRQVEMYCCMNTHCPIQPKVTC